MVVETVLRLSVSTKADDYWAGLSYLMDKHKPETLAEALHLVSVVETYIAQHCEGDLSRLLAKK